MTEPDRLIEADAKQGEEAQEHALRPKRLSEYVGQPSVHEQMEILLVQRDNVMTRWIMCLFLARLVWVKRRWHILSPMKWVSLYDKRRALYLKGRAILPRY